MVSPKGNAACESPAAYILNRELKFGTFVDKPYALGCNSSQFLKTFAPLSFLFDFFAAEK